MSIERPSCREQIEQDRAFGRSVTWTAERLGISTDDVLDAWLEQDAANCETDEPRPGCGKRDAA